ncbi:hypothetical protein KP509_05G056800 [Ceratopteris richardii]|uniref:Uncharacterized protein n=1 Tax=Ceratopteris richardii TaxID=49495 RepID=A0A8T2UNY5_CERRI|nr:hypothetical protein KP509_05G056800 [Ceratopteris richardii]
MDNVGCLGYSFHTIPRKITSCCPSSSISSLRKNILLITNIPISKNNLGLIGINNSAREDTRHPTTRDRKYGVRSLDYKNSFQGDELATRNNSKASHTTRFQQDKRVCPRYKTRQD